MGKTVYALGETLIDMVPADGGTELEAGAYVPKAGGAPANVAACVAKLGGQAAFIGRRGRDAFGELLHRTLAAACVDTRHYVATDEAKTALAFVTLTADGDRSFLFYRDPSADLLLHQGDVPLEAFDESSILHVGSVSLTGEPSRSATLYAAKEAKERGAFVSYDPNWRPALWAVEEEGLAAIRELYPYCSLIKVNREELVLFTGTPDVKAGSEYFHNLGIRYVLVTLDADGCYYSVDPNGDGQRSSGHIAGKAVRCVDTTGAGDAFIGSVLYKLSLYDKETPPDADSMAEWAAFAVAASALVTLRKGAIAALPTLEEVEAMRSREA